MFMESGADAVRGSITYSSAYGEYLLQPGPDEKRHVVCPQQRLVSVHDLQRSTSVSERLQLPGVSMLLDQVHVRSWLCRSPMQI